MTMTKYNLDYYLSLVWLLYFVLLLRISVHLSNAKIFHRCDLAHILKDTHQLSIDEVAILVCIAERQSGLNSSAINYDSSGIGYHGLFQISDQYWCEPTATNNKLRGKVCELNCGHLRDVDLTDDLRCIHRIYGEHQRLSGDGYNAWIAYQHFCKHSNKFVIKDCFTDIPNVILPSKNLETNKEKMLVHGKVYTKCELARELQDRHRLPREQIPIWVCIAKHESNFDTAAVGRLNSDGSEDHGIFQISDLWWCSPPGHGVGCNLPCAKFEDSDISDDVDCIKTIFKEHQQLNGNGFTAWAVYQPYCQEVKFDYVEKCFVDNVDDVIKYPYLHKPGIYATTTPMVRKYFNDHRMKSVTGKIYDRCELARDLKFKFNIPEDQLATWICIVKHESGYNTSAVGRLNADGSGDHGLFQISDIWWCSPPGSGWVCDIACEKFEDSDISDDVECVKKIFDEHKRLFGDGFNAWAVYQPHCKDRSLSIYVDGCFSDGKLNKKSDLNIDINQPQISILPNFVNVQTFGDRVKIYDRCELAIELNDHHRFSKDEVAIWVCIAFHESGFNTSAVGRLSDDESVHGLFQISDKYWCSQAKSKKTCNIPCSKLEDSNITDDVECIKIIFEEHERISGDGFNAWPVYKPYCRRKSYEFIHNCWNATQTTNLLSTTIKKWIQNTTQLLVEATSEVSKGTSNTGKIYSNCELAQELRFRHNITLNQISIWVCIAYHESGFNTSAIGRLNADGSADHGLFQISDLWWCSPPGKGWACNIACSNLEDSDISDDIQCIRKIHDEHTRISGDGFTAWTVYNSHCRGNTDRYIDGCFTDNFGVKQSKDTDDKMKKNAEPEKKSGKIFKVCELAEELQFKHKISMVQIADWVCIAKSQSEFNTSLVKKLDGIGYHGIFQISDQYWCSPPGFGNACKVTCLALEDSDITDDIECAQKIYSEHSHLYNNGFHAWPVYYSHCKGRSNELIAECFIGGEVKDIRKPQIKIHATSNEIGKVYERCELARELKFKHNILLDQIPTWVCIAKHESEFNASAVRSLNADGSVHYGLFQISDNYSCLPPDTSQACNVTYDKLRDKDLTDDVACIRRIYEHHLRLSGDGFNPWAVYKTYCKDVTARYTEDCFDNPVKSIEKELKPNVIKTTDFQLLSMFEASSATNGTIPLLEATKTFSKTTILRDPHQRSPKTTTRYHLKKKLPFYKDQMIVTTTKPYQFQTNSYFKTGSSYSFTPDRTTKSLVAEKSTVSTQIIPQISTARLNTLQSLFYSKISNNASNKSITTRKPTANSQQTKKITNLFEFYLNGWKTTKKLSTLTWLGTTKVPKTEFHHQKIDIKPSETFHDGRSTTFNKSIFYRDNNSINNNTHKTTMKMQRLIY